MKKNCAITVLAAAMFLMSAVSCTKEVSNPDSTTKFISNSATEEAKSPTNQPPKILWPDTTVVKKSGY